MKDRTYKKIKKRTIITLIITGLLFIALIIGYKTIMKKLNNMTDKEAAELLGNLIQDNTEKPVISTIKNFSLDIVPEYSEEVYISIRDDIPYFYSKEIRKGEEAYIEYSSLDSLGRCGSAVISIDSKMILSCKKEDKDIIPSGFNDTYEKCSLFSFLSVEERNLITGTETLEKSIREVETRVLNFIKENPDKHCLYRVTPIYEEDNLICTGVLMEALSVEDVGATLMFCIYCYNV